MGEKLVDSYYIERLHTLIQELEEEVKAKKDGWCICIGENIRLRKALEEIQVEVRKPEKLPRDMEKWLKRADKRTKLKKIDDIATKALKEK